MRLVRKIVIIVAIIRVIIAPVVVQIVTKVTNSTSYLDFLRLSLWGDSGVAGFPSLPERMPYGPW